MKSMTVADLRAALDVLADHQDAIVCIGKGCGPLGTITPTSNAFVILDPVRPE